jgi:FixJ family two-component response regulator
MAMSHAQRDGGIVYVVDDDYSYADDLAALVQQLDLKTRQSKQQKDIDNDLAGPQGTQNGSTSDAD